MSVALIEGVIRLDGGCAVEEAETLAALLTAHPDALVDVTGCDSLHAAALQALISFAPQVGGTFADSFLNLWIRPVLAGGAGP